ncbi:actin filament-associated protein 1-like 2 isoform X2 [Amia ocellicauda]|uniref:actin filament-associated protein 1-like 2 isoform X2 n=1 Tax=Amia ocellicauda TaxID=2972642 RepID=UPI0034649E4A
MDKQKELNQLISDLQSFLLVLDRENLSYIAQAKKKSISDLLSKLQDTPAEDAEYMIMNCPSGAANSDLRESHLPDSGSLLSARDDENSEDPSSSAEWPLNGTVPMLPSCSPDDLDDDCYEEAEPFLPSSQATGVDSDSSHYESYGEEEDFVKDRAHYIQWSASQPCLRSTPESRICGYLWKKKWLGQWTKQLFIIRNHLLLCYKCAKDLHPQLEVSLRGCHVVYKSKHSKKMQHELKVVTSSETVVIGFQSCQQAEEWRKVIEEVSGSSYYERESSSSLLKSDRQDSCRSSTVLQTDSEEERNSVLPSATNSLELKDKGFLNVLMNCQWQSLWCHVEGGMLKMFRDAQCEESPQYCVLLQGCEVSPGLDTVQAYRITVSQHGTNMAVLEAACTDDRERWLHLLQDASMAPSEPASLYEHLDPPLLTHPNSPLSGLLDRRFPSSNMYIDDPFQQLCGASQLQPVYSNTSVLEHMFQNSKNVTQGQSMLSIDLNTYSNSEVFSNHIRHSRKTVSELGEDIQKMDVANRTRAQLKAGSEMNLLSVGKSGKRTSFRQSLAFCTDSSGSQGGFLTPLLRRTASAKNSLKRVPSSFFLEKSKVFQKKKEWELKASG